MPVAPETRRADPSPGVDNNIVDDSTVRMTCGMEGGIGRAKKAAEKQNKAETLEVLHPDIDSKRFWPTREPGWRAPSERVAMRVGISYGGARI